MSGRGSRHRTRYGSNVRRAKAIERQILTLNQELDAINDEIPISRTAAQASSSPKFTGKKGEAQSYANHLKHFDHNMAFARRAMKGAE